MAGLDATGAIASQNAVTFDHDRCGAARRTCTRGHSHAGPIRCSGDAASFRNGRRMVAVSGPALMLRIRAGGCRLYPKRGFRRGRP